MEPTQRPRLNAETEKRLDQLTEAIESLLHIRQVLAAQLKADTSVADLAVDRTVRALVICLDVKQEARS